jgi:hypothetical protein
MRSSLSINAQLTLVTDGQGSELFVQADEEQTLMNGRELFSFGSGSWVDGVEAREVLESDAKFLPFNVSFDTKFILEKRKVLQHLEGMSGLEKAVPLRELLSELQDFGEVTCQV